jgi:two-component system, chemotaxis family, CheB/CheR fusion protein
MLKLEEVKKIGSFSPLDAETFAALEQEVLPQLITRARLDHQPLRVWVVECAIGEIATIIMLLLARLLGYTLPNFRIQIFATDRNETHLVYAHRGIFERNSLSQFQDSEIARFCEPVESGYRLRPSLRKLLTFGRHDLWHDPFFARLDLIVCSFSLLDYPLERQQQFLSQAGTSLTPSGHIIFSRHDCAILAHSLYQPMEEGIPIYQYAPVEKEPDPPLFAEEPVEAQKSPDLVVASMYRLLQTPTGDADALEERVSENQGSRAHVPVALDVLLRFAPIGIVVIDHRYQILFFNRAAHKLLTLQIQEERPPDFFHVIAGLPYQEVRTAIDTVIREGTSQAIEEVELIVSAGGNGRVLSLEIYSMPTEIGTPSRLALYVQDVTLQTVQKKIQLQQVQIIQELSTANAHLNRKYSDLERCDERLREASNSLLTEYQSLAAQLKAAQEARRLLDQQVEQLLEEITVLTEQPEQ